MDADTAMYRDRLARMAPAIGRIVVKAPNRKVINFGSGVGLRINGIKVIATAAHVVNGLRGVGDGFFQTLDHVRRGGRDVGRLPREYPLDLSSAIVLDERQGIDAAVIPASPQLADRVGWLDGDYQTEAVRLVRENLPVTVSIFGFPRFSRFLNEPEAIEAAIAFPIWGHVSQWASPVAARREVVVEVEVPTPDWLADDAGEVGRLITWQLWEMTCGRLQDPDKSVLGGYSGGPVFYMDYNGAAVVALVSQGDVKDYGSKVFAVPIDDAIEAIKRTPAWRALVARHRP